jgi:hypothetical protein
LRIQVPSNSGKSNGSRVAADTENSVRGSQDQDFNKKHSSSFPETRGEMKKARASNKRAYATSEKPLALSPGKRAIAESKKPGSAVFPENEIRSI